MKKCFLIRYLNDGSFVFEVHPVQKELIIKGTMIMIDGIEYKIFGAAEPM